MASSVKQVPIRSLPLPDSAVRAKFTDTMDIDQEAHRLYYGDNWSGGVDVFDISTKEAKFLQTIKIRGNLYGIAMGKNVNKVFAGLSASQVAVIDIDPASPKVNTVIARVNTGGQGAADLLDYDPVHKKVYVGNHDDGFVTSIDAVHNEVMKRIGGLGGAIEQPRFNPADGMVYVSGRTDNVLYQINPEIFGGNPVRLLANVPTETGASWVAYDETHDLIYAPAIQNGKPALISFPVPAT